MKTSSTPQDAQAALLMRLWLQFSEEFATEEDCVEALYKKLAADGMVRCKKCNSSEISRNYGERVGRCLSCNRDSWFTAGTFFFRIRKARPWLAAIWLMEQGVAVNCAQLHRLLQIAPSTAWVMLKKINMVIQHAMHDEISCSEPSASFLPVVCKRSMMTPAGCHPIAEQADLEKCESESTSVGLSTSPRESIGEAIGFIRKFFHGTSRKYLQTFLAAYWCQFDRERWSSLALLKACSTFSYVDRDLILSFISPLTVKFACPVAAG